MRLRSARENNSVDHQDSYIPLEFHTTFEHRLTELALFPCSLEIFCVFCRSNEPTLTSSLIFLAAMARNIGRNKRIRVSELSDLLRDDHPPTHMDSFSALLTSPMIVNPL